MGYLLLFGGVFEVRDVVEDVGLSVDIVVGGIFVLLNSSSSGSSCSGSSVCGGCMCEEIKVVEFVLE